MRSERIGIGPPCSTSSIKIEDGNMGSSGTGTGIVNIIDTLGAAVFGGGGGRGSCATDWGAPIQSAGC